MSKVQAHEEDGSDEHRAVLDVLSALEYGARKEETPLLDLVLKKLGAKRAWTKAATAHRILDGPGFEAFLLAVLREAQPFARMLQDVYGFLNRTKVFTHRRASIFRVSSQRAEAELSFALDNFPRELLKVLTESELRGAVVKLSFPGVEVASEGVVDWDGSEANKAWRAISPNWDGDFYDDGFHKALSYVHTILPSGEDALWSRLREAVEPILDRLAAIVACCNEIEPVKTGEVVWYQGREQVRFQLALPTVRSHRVLQDEARTALAALTRPQYKNETRRTVHDEIRWSVSSMAVAIHLFHDEKFSRDDRDGWLQKRLGRLSPEFYVSWVEQLAVAYEQALDRVAPVVGNYSNRVLQEKLLEFLLLPFWKHRWFLYELWSLVLVLEAAEEEWPVELEGLEESEGGILEWKLPGGMASRPVATIGTGIRQALCWTQRKTYHPGTGEGLEPDLRLTGGGPTYRDLFIVENKDRRRPSGTEMKEIARRYVEGTSAESFWLVNYDSFAGGLEALESSWAGRHVHVVSEFRPDGVPPEFADEVRAVLARHVEVGALASADETVPEVAELEVSLSWGVTPRDLDLHAWVARNDGTWHLSFSEKGDVGQPPYATLNEDMTHGNGREVLRVGRSGLQRLVIAVHNYSDEASLSSSGAELSLKLPGGSIRLRAPTQGTGRWWLAADYDPQAENLEVSNRIEQQFSAPEGIQVPTSLT